MIGALAAVPPTPPFIMEIVEAQNVREVQFDAETGKPIRHLVDADSVSGPAVTPSLSPTEVGGANAGGKAGDGESLIDDFPIDLGS